MMNLDATQLLSKMIRQKQILELKKQNASRLDLLNKYRERINETNLIIEVINFKDNSSLSIKEKFEQECV